MGFVLVLVLNLSCKVVVYWCWDVIGDIGKWFWLESVEVVWVWFGGGVYYVYVYVYVCYGDINIDWGL